MPELGEETKRHGEDYYWIELCSSHHMYPCDKNTTFLWVQAVKGQKVAGRFGTTDHTGLGYTVGCKLL